MIKTNLEIKEEFKKEYYQTDNLTYLEEDGSSRANVYKIIDWWLSKLQQRMDEMEGEVSQIKVSASDSYEWRADILQEIWKTIFKPIVLNIIKSVDKK